MGTTSHWGTTTKISLNIPRYMLKSDSIREKKNVSIHTISQINGFIQGVIQHFIALLKMNLPN